ncbi:phage portal protein [Nocardioides sp. GXZ039]|uniref:phage portal protein n=1 Tax=Nocardioides sp. GXZ039 TaxID=3136018 RepID=UPI0030F39225
MSVDPGVLYGAPTLDDYIFRTGRITRAEALRVPPVKRARDLICGAIGQFALRFYDQNGKPAENFSPNLFQQPEPGLAPSVTWTRVVEDMLLFERSWLQHHALGWHNRVVQVHRLEPESVTVQPEYRYFPHGSVKVWPEVPDLIRVDSPNTGLLDGGPAIRACIALERAALNAVDGAPPIAFFTPDGDADPFESTADAKARLLDPWEESRRDRSTGYVPAGVKYVIPSWDPEKLQLAEAREFAITEVARLTGIDAEELSVSTTSRTYFNAQDRRRQRIEDVLGPYMTAIEGRLSMDDVSPHGYTAAFDTSGYLRLDDLSAAQTDAVLISAKVLDPDEARVKRGLEPRGEQAAPVDPAEIGTAVAASVAVEAAKEGARRG